MWPLMISFLEFASETCDMLPDSFDCTACCSYTAFSSFSLISNSDTEPVDFVIINIRNLAKKKGGEIAANKIKTLPDF